MQAGNHGLLRDKTGSSGNGAVRIEMQRSPPRISSEAPLKITRLGVTKNFPLIDVGQRGRDKVYSPQAAGVGRTTAFDVVCCYLC